MNVNDLFVFSGKIANVDEPMAAEYLWESLVPWSMFGQQKLLIKAALERYPALTGPRKQAINCFSHVQVLLPHRIAELDRRVLQDARKQALREQLEEAHKRDLQHYTPDETEVRYSVTGCKELKENEVAYKFGYAVYVPRPDEQPAYELSVSLSSGEQNRLCYIYPKQRLILINGDPFRSSHCLSAWPFGAHCSVLLVNHFERGEFEVLAEPEESLRCTRIERSGIYRIQGEFDGELEFTITPLVDASSDCTDQVMSTPTERHRYPQASSERVDKVREARRGKRAPNLHSPEEATIVPNSSAKLSLVGLLLQHLSVYQEYGFDTLRVGFTIDGELCSPDSPLVVAVLKLARNGEVISETTSGENILVPPLCWRPVKGVDIVIEPPPQVLNKIYAMFLRLPGQIEYQLPQCVRRTLGRGEKSQIQPGLLRSAQVTTSKNNLPVQSAERMGFSREVAHLEASEGGLIVIPAGHNTLWHLDNYGVGAEMIGKEESRLIPDGDYLVAGHYLIKYEKS